MSQMKVFKMNEYDWVAALNEEEAENFYIEEFGIDEGDLDIREVDEDDTMWFVIYDPQELMSKLIEATENFTEVTVGRFQEEIAIKIPYSLAVEWTCGNCTQPLVIASTEF